MVAGEAAGLGTLDGRVVYIYAMYRDTRSSSHAVAENFKEEKQAKKDAKKEREEKKKAEKSQRRAVGRFEGFPI